MISFIEHKRSTLTYRVLCAFIALTFVFSIIVPPAPIYAQATLPPSLLNLPLPGTMVSLTPGFNPPLVKGITINPDNPLQFDFLVSPGDDKLAGIEFRTEAKKLIKYFLAGLTVPDNELWVNLSPYEQDRIISDQFGQTEMGRDLLAQDYILKQLTASLMYPEDELGKKFWDRVYKKAQAQYGTTEIPMNTFNKIWIVPETAVVYEHEQTAYVVESHLKVMLEEDYIALNKNIGESQFGLDSVTENDAEIISGVSSEVVREVLIPEIEKEINEGEVFTQLRQIYNSLILASWYKDNMKQSLLGQIYVDRNKTKGVDHAQEGVNQQIYEQYTEAFKKGVYNYIREDYDPSTDQIIPRKYFSGGVGITSLRELGGKDGIRFDTDRISIARQRAIDDPSIQELNVDLLALNAKNVAALAAAEADLAQREKARASSPLASKENQGTLGISSAPVTGDLLTSSTVKASKAPESRISLESDLQRREASSPVKISTVIAQKSNPDVDAALKKIEELSSLSELLSLTGSIYHRPNVNRALIAKRDELLGINVDTEIDNEGEILFGRFNTLRSDVDGKGASSQVNVTLQYADDLDTVRKIIVSSGEGGIFESKILEQVSFTDQYTRDLLTVLIDDTDITQLPDGRYRKSASSPAQRKKNLDDYSTKKLDSLLANALQLRVSLQEEGQSGDTRRLITRNEKFIKAIEGAIEKKKTSPASSPVSAAENVGPASLAKRSERTSSPVTEAAQSPEGTESQVSLESDLQKREASSPVKLPLPENPSEIPVIRYKNPDANTFYVLDGPDQALGFLKSTITNKVIQKIRTLKYSRNKAAGYRETKSELINRLVFRDGNSILIQSIANRDKFEPIDLTEAYKAGHRVLWSSDGAITIAFNEIDASYTERRELTSAERIMPKIAASAQIDAVSSPVEAEAERLITNTAPLRSGNQELTRFQSDVLSFIKSVDPNVAVGMDKYNELEHLEVEIFQLGEALGVSQSELAHSVADDLELLDKDSYSDRANLEHQFTYIKELQGDILGLDLALMSGAQESIRIYLKRLLVDTNGLTSVAWTTLEKTGDFPNFRQKSLRAKINQYKKVAPSKSEAASPVEARSAQINDAVEVLQSEINGRTDKTTREILHFIRRQFPVIFKDVEGLPAVYSFSEDPKDEFVLNANSRLGPIKIATVKVDDGSVQTTLHPEGFEKFIGSASSTLETGKMPLALIDYFVKNIRYFTLMGKPGSGKGTLSEFVLEAVNAKLPEGEKFEIVSFGDVVRAIKALKADRTSAEKTYAEYLEIEKLLSEKDIEAIDSGKLADDNLVIHVINLLLNNNPRLTTTKRIFFDGFPRTMPQFESFENGKITHNGQSVKMDFYSEVFVDDKHNEGIIRRIVRRAELRSAAGLRVRSDDKPEIVRKRLIEYSNDTRPMIERISADRSGNNRSIVFNGFMVSPEDPTDEQIEESKREARRLYFEALIREFDIASSPLPNVIGSSERAIIVMDDVQIGDLVTYSVLSRNFQYDGDTPPVLFNVVLGRDEQGYFTFNADTSRMTHRLAGLFEKGSIHTYDTNGQFITGAKSGSQWAVQFDHNKIGQIELKNGQQSAPIVKKASSPVNNGVRANNLGANAYRLHQKSNKSLILKLNMLTGKIVLTDSMSVRSNLANPDALTLNVDDNGTLELEMTPSYSVVRDHLRFRIFRNRNDKERGLSQNTAALLFHVFIMDKDTMVIESVSPETVIGITLKDGSSLDDSVVYMSSLPEELRSSSPISREEAGAIVDSIATDLNAADIFTRDNAVEFFKEKLFDLDLGSTRLDASSVSIDFDDSNPNSFYYPINWTSGNTVLQIASVSEDGDVTLNKPLLTVAIESLPASSPVSELNIDSLRKQTLRYLERLREQTDRRVQALEGKTHPIRWLGLGDNAEDAAQRLDRLKRDLSISRRNRTLIQVVIVEKRLASSPIDLSDVPRAVVDRTQLLLPIINQEISELIGLTEKQALQKFSGNHFSHIGFDPANRLGWTIPRLQEILDDPGMLDETFEVAERLRDNYKYVIFSGMGGSGLSMQVVNDTFRSETGPKMYSLSTTDAGAIGEIIDEIIGSEGGDVEEALKKLAFVSSTKSFTTAETLSHQAYIEKLYGDYNVQPVEGQFTIFTDPTQDTEILQKQAKSKLSGYDIRFIQANNKTDVGGRFTAPTTNIFLLPLSIRRSRSDVLTILKRALEMNTKNTEHDIFGHLGFYLDHMDRYLGKDKVTMIVPQEFSRLPHWSEQLFEESLGKKGKGISIVYGERLMADDLAHPDTSDRVFLRVNLGGVETNEILVNRLTFNRHPVFNINVDSIDDIGGIMLGFQRAVTIFAAQQGINFVTQPGVEGYKAATRSVLDELEPGQQVTVPSMDHSVFRSLKVYYEPFIKAGIATKAEIRREVEYLNGIMSDGAAVYAALINIANRKAKQMPDKVGTFELAEIATYGRMTEEFRHVMEAARFDIFTDGLKIASKLGEGPNKNHSYQQTIEDGKNYHFSTYLKALKTEQSKYAEYDTTVNDAIPIGTMNSLVKSKRKVVLITMDGTIAESVDDVDVFFKKVHSFVDNAAAASPIGSGDQTKPTILLVEDEPNIREINEWVLSETYNVVAAANGEEALEILRARRFQFDLVFTDQRMPKVTGVELVKTVAKEFPGIRSIIYTGTPEDVEDAFERDLDFDRALVTVLSKPAGSEEIRNKTASVLKQIKSSSSPITDEGDEGDILTSIPLGDRGSEDIEINASEKTRKDYEEAEKTSRKPKADKTEDSSSPVGGINLNPALLDLQIKRDGNGIPLPLHLQPVDVMNIDGLLPVIINITPVINLPLLLGFDMPEEKPYESADSETDSTMELGLIDKFRMKFDHVNQIETVNIAA